MTTILSPREKKADTSFEAHLQQPVALSAIHINEQQEEYILHATAAGLRREDFFISVDKKVLTIITAGKEGEPYFKNSLGKNLSEQVRTFTLPDNADPLLTSASYDNGSLEIHIPKGENTEKQPVLIHVY